MADMTVMETSGTSLAMEFTPSEASYQKLSFQTFVNLSTDRGKPVVVFFRSILAFLKSKDIEHFHLKIVPSSSAFSCLVFYGGDKHKPRHRKACISCDLDNDVAKASSLGSTKHNRLWIDGKFRPMFIVTPIDHVEHMSQLSDDQLYALWRDACDLLAKQSQTESKDCPFERMVVNHGNYRNLAHLHLKIGLKDRVFQGCVKGWSEELRAQFQRLQELCRDPAVLKAFIGGRAKAKSATKKEGSGAPPRELKNEATTGALLTSGTGATRSAPQSLAAP